MLTRERIADLAGIITTAAVVGVGHAIGGTTGAQAMASIGINLISSVIANGSVKLKEQWVASSHGIRNQDIQQALQRALLKAFTHLETRYFTLGQAQALPKNEQDSIRELFNELRRQMQEAFLAQVEQVMQKPAVQEYLYASPEMARDRLWEQINGPELLHTYNEDFTSFLRQNLLHEVEFCFSEELKTDTPACTRAWRAFQRLLLEGIQADVQAVKAQQDVILQDLQTLQVVKRQLEALQEVRREPHEPFLHAIETAMHDVRMAVQDVASTTQRTEAKIDALSAYLQQSQQRLIEELGITKAALTSFFKILGQQDVPPENRDAKLWEIATSYKQLQAQLQSFTSEDPAVITLRREASQALETGDFAQVETLLRQAQERDLQAIREQQASLRKRALSAAAMSAELGRLKNMQLAYADAAIYYRHAAAIVPRDEALAQAEYLNLEGCAWYQARQYTDAQPPLEHALAIVEKAFGPEHPEVATSLHNLAGVYKAQGRSAEAEPLYQRALAIREKAFGPEHPDIATSLHNLAVLYRAQGRSAEAEPLYQRALAIWEKAFGPEHPEVAPCLHNLGELYLVQGRYTETELLMQRALAIWEKAFGPEHPEVAPCLHNLAGVYYVQGCYTEAELLMQRALAIWEKAFGPEYPDVAVILEHYAALLQALNRNEEAKAFEARAQMIRASHS